MPRFEPFPGHRYSTGADLSQLACPPYDVIDAPERAALAELSPRNAVHLELPTGPDPYTGAASVFAEWRASGALAQDPPTLYAYRMTPPEGQPTLGYLGALGVTDADGLLPHEQTTPKARSDRLDLLRATRVNTSPIWALSLAPGISSLYRPEGDPIASATDQDGVVHEMWAVPEEQAAEICAAVSAAPAAVADGHHRWETSRNYLSERTGDPGADRILALVVELAPEQLEVRPIHRLVGSLPQGVELPAALDPWFEAAGPDEAEITALVGGETFALKALPGTWEGAAHDADAERLQLALDALGIDDVVYPHDPEVVGDAVRAGKAAAGFLLRPVSVDVISAAARAGERFPPKTTFFWPKPLTGFVYRSLDA